MGIDWSNAYKVVQRDLKKQLDKKSSVEIRLYDHSSGNVIYKRLTIKELVGIQNVLGVDVSKTKLNELDNWTIQIYCDKE